MSEALSPSASDFTPSIVLIGVPHTKALERVIEKLKLNRIQFSPFVEPDNGLGLTAVATVPLTEEQRVVLQNYKVFSHARSSVVRALRAVDGEVGCSNRSARTNLRGWESSPGTALDMAGSTPAPPHQDARVA